MSKPNVLFLSLDRSKLELVNKLRLINKEEREKLEFLYDDLLESCQAQLSQIPCINYLVGSNSPGNERRFNPNLDVNYWYKVEFPSEQAATLFVLKASDCPALVVIGDEVENC